MRKAQIAEWILSLVTSPERAAATVGDLMEGAAGLGALWFWASIASTALSLLWRALVADPWRLTGLAARALVVEALILALSGLLLAFGFGVAVVAGWAIPLSAATPTWHFTVLAYVLIIVAQFVIGRWLAKRAPGQELAACAALILLESALGLAANVVWPSPLGQVILGLTLYQIPPAVPLFAGAALVRRVSRDLASV